MEKKPSFEESIRRLEEIVSGLESGELSLDQSLKLFEEGVGLARNAGEKLGAAEQKVSKLIKDEEGAVVGSEPFDKEKEPESPAG